MTTGKSKEKKQRLLAAAGDVFMEKGFRDATVAEICARAKANVSAVNYHFGSKETLYQETWRHSLTESLKTYPIDGGVSASAPAEERLRGQLAALILRIADERNREFYIAQTELINSTGLLQEVMQAEMIPIRQQTLAVVRELLGPQATEQEIEFCEITITSMCIHPMILRRIAQRPHGQGLPGPIDDIPAFVDHVAAFSLAGLKALRAAREVKA